MDELGQGLDLTEDTGGGVDVGDGDELVLLLFQGLLDGVELWAVANWRLELCHLAAVGLEAVGKAVGKVAGVQHQHVVAWLGQVGGDLVPAQGTATVDDEGLRGGVGGLEELAEHGQALAKDLDEGHADMRLAVEC